VDCGLWRPEFAAGPSLDAMPFNSTSKNKFPPVFHYSISKFKIRVIKLFLMDASASPLRLMEQMKDSLKKEEVFREMVKVSVRRTPRLLRRRGRRTEPT
jgi:hypothetical protein